MNVRALVIDDEPLARRRLSRILNERQIDVVALGENGQQAIDLVEQHKVDIVFLDINMPLKNGLEAAKEIVAAHAEPPAIIFCTAYDEYAIDAFKVQAAGYLLKPIDALDLDKAVERATKLTKLQVGQLLESRVEPQESAMSDHVSISQDNAIENHPIDDLLYFRAEQKQVVAGFKDGREVFINSTLKALEINFPNDYVRAHRNTLVNKSYISKLERDESGSAFLSLSDLDQKFLVSRRHMADIKRCFSNK